MFSETHIFPHTLSNEFRVGFNDIRAQRLQFNAANAGFAASIGFGGIPAVYLNGGIPAISFSGGAFNIANFGSGGYSPGKEKENVYQIVDNVTKIVGNHALKAGVNFLSMRFSTLEPPSARGNYSYNGEHTSNLNAPNTGFAAADFLLDSQNSAVLSSEFASGQARWYDAAYVQDDWRATKQITLNAGLRWEYFQPYQDVGGYQASYSMNGPLSLNTATGYGSGSATLQFPAEVQGYVQSIFAQTSNAFPNLLAKDNIALQFNSDPHLIQAQKTNFGPRLGIAYSPGNNISIRAGYGLFYGGLENAGYMPNLGQNYPFQFDSSFPSGNCSATSCPTDGIAIGNGFSTILAHGLTGNVTDLSLRGTPPALSTPYTEDYNLSIQRSLIGGMLATVTYVGDASHHLGSITDPNSPLALENPSNSTQNTRPLPDFGSTDFIDHVGNSNYNGMQAKLERRYAKGKSLLVTYTWSHSLDDAPALMISNADAGFRQTNLIPAKAEYSNSTFDTRQRFTFNALFDLPFGAGHKFLSNTGVLNNAIDGWSINLTFAAQTGNPFSVTPTAISSASGGKAEAVKIKDQAATGGTFSSPDPSIQVACAARTRTRQNWYNPCSFQNPWNPNDWAYETQHYIPTGTSDPHYAAASQPVYVTNPTSVVGYLGGRRNAVYGPGYERISMSVFKIFPAFREQTVLFRADIFNLLNTPSLGQPSDMTIDSTGGVITGPRSFQKLTPDARFIQLSLKYAF